MSIQKIANHEKATYKYLSKKDAYRCAKFLFKHRQYLNVAERKELIEVSRCRF